MRTLPIWSDDSQRDIEYFVCNDVETLLHIANLGAIPLHIGGAPGLGMWVTTLPGYTSSVAQGVNDAGQTVGYAFYDLPNGLRYYRAFLWQNGAISDLGTLAGPGPLSLDALIARWRKRRAVSSETAHL